MIVIDGHKIYEDLPASSVDLDKACVIGWSAFDDICNGDEIIDDIIEAGTVDDIQWGKTNLEGEISAIMIDAEFISEDIIKTLSSNGII